MRKLPAKLPATAAAAVKQISPGQVTQPLLWPSAQRIWVASGLSATASEGKQTDLWACELIQSKPGTVYGDLDESQAEAHSPPSLLRCCLTLLSTLIW